MLVGRRQRGHGYESEVDYYRQQVDIEVKFEFIHLEVPLVSFFLPAWYLFVVLS